MSGLDVIVLAAGLGTRMKSSLVKVLHPVAGRPMLLYAIDNLRSLGPDSIVVVVGHQAEKVRAVLPDDILTAHQKEQLGTAHAALTGLKRLKGARRVMVVSGDTPLLGPDTFKRLIDAHALAGADVSLLTAVMDDPTGYGRVIRNGGEVERIVEQKDAGPSERAVREVNAGTYLFEAKAFRAALKEVRSENAQKEFYLTDVVEITRRRGGKVIGVVAERPEESLGVNSRVELAQAERMIRRKVNRALMESGVTLIDPENTYIAPGAVIGRDTVIYPNNHITGDSVVGEGCLIMPGNVISDSTVKSGAVIKGYCVITESCVDEGASVGPFAHLRPGSRLGAKSKVGNFVELKKSLIGEGSKASHLSYIGDTVVGRGVNIGAGTITCNYDGSSKFQTVIEDDVFVGSDTQLVAPVRVGKGAVVAAGTTVTKDVPKDALAISRAPQTNVPGWAKRNREEKAKAKGGN